jgi:hypothetical protein
MHDDDDDNNYNIIIELYAGNKGYLIYNIISDIICSYQLHSGTAI